ncbi:hypothetical protein [Thalassospira xiamenensis]|uniref:hypothetical protein n=1 Tax=Thalassospira xiamenensis TaxID=220697 RepID=UPI0020003F3E|nr:hypothetical protein [Thalassospira xiamenensis]MCK2165953.1 hypothetical protein [Thalassospira xiamenensis]
MTVDERMLMHFPPSVTVLSACPNAAICPAKPSPCRMVPGLADPPVPVASHRIIALQTAPTPKGHISPVMMNTNFPKIPRGLMARTHDRRNGFSTRPSCPFGDVAAAFSISQIDVLSSSFSCLSGPNTQKPAKAHHALRVLGPGAFAPLTLSLCHKHKNKSRTIFRKFACHLPKQNPAQTGRVSTY